MRRRSAVLLAEIDLSKCGPDSPLHQLSRRKGQRAKALEHEYQVAVFAWAEAHHSRHPSLEYLFAVPNWFGVRTAKQGARAKAEGRKRGVPDIWFPVARGGYHGLVIEMKAGEHRPTPEQKRWLVFLDAAGWKTDICYSADDAIARISDYLAA